MAPSFADIPELPSSRPADGGMQRQEARVAAATSSYEHVLIRYGFAVERRGPWVCVGSPRDAFNWKIHLSSVQAQAQELLRRVLPLLATSGCPFKVAVDEVVLAGLNEGVFGATQVGKFVTIYPPRPDDGLGLAERLLAATSGLDGPSVVTDLHLGSVVYVRYGSHSPPMVRDRLGNVDIDDTDGAGAYRVPFEPPTGLANPYYRYAPPPAATAAPRPVGPGYILLKPLQVHAKGSVFLALDVRRQEDVRVVVIKEGRRGCMSDEHGRDMRDRLHHQARIHARVASLVPVPRVEEHFVLHGNVYLPQEFIDGYDLAQRQARPYGALDDNERSRLARALAQTAEAVAALHAHGVVHRDLSPRNVRVQPDGAVFLLDLEIAHDMRAARSSPFRQGTAGFMSPQQASGEYPSPSDDVYSLGCLIVYGITGMGGS